MPRIPNLADFDVESEQLEQLRSVDPLLWNDLKASGYEVTTPDVLGCSGSETTSWFIEVGAHRSIAWIWCQREGVFLGPKFQVNGEPAAAVARARALLEAVAQEEALSGVPADMRTKQGELVYVDA